MGSWPWCAALETFGWEGWSISRALHGHGSHHGGRQQAARARLPRYLDAIKVFHERKHFLYLRGSHSTR